MQFGTRTRVLVWDNAVYNLTVDPVYVNNERSTIRAFFFRAHFHTSLQLTAQLQTSLTYSLELHEFKSMQKTYGSSPTSAFFRRRAR